MRVLVVLLVLLSPPAWAVYHCPDGTVGSLKGQSCNLTTLRCCPGLVCIGGGCKLGVATTTTTPATTTTLRVQTTTTTAAGATSTTTTQPTAEGAWQHLATVWGAEPGDFPLLHSLGVNLAIVTVGLDQPTWESFYAAAIANDISLITVLWDGSLNNAHWLWNGHRYLMNPATDSASDPRVAYVTYLKTHPEALAHTFATYTFHEPGNPDNSGGGETCAQMQSLWHDWHALGLGIPLYGESVTDVDCCASGCVDYTNLGVYPFKSGGGYWAITAAYDPVGQRINYGQFPASEATAVVSARDNYCTNVLDRIAMLPPAPDGTRTKELFLLGLHGDAPDGLRTPTAAEMEYFYFGVVEPLKPRTVGFTYYPFTQVAGNYTDWLQRHIGDPAYVTAVDAIDANIAR